MSSKKRHNYKNLKIWQIGLEISFDLSDVVAELPKHERYGLSSQLSRCSVSVPSNIAEGSVKSDKSFSNYVDRALGLSFESETQLLVSNHRKYINKKILTTLKEKIAEFQRQPMSFQNKLNR